MYQPKSVALPVTDIIATDVLGGVVNPQFWGRGGVADGTIRKSIGEFP